MNKSDLGVVAFVYAICLFFGYFLLELPPEAQTYPLCLIGGLFILNSLFLGVNLVKASKNGWVNDLPQIFAGFLPGQFVFVLAACLCFFLGTFILGFYITGILFLLTVMRYLKVPLRNAVITVLFISLVIYGTFTLFLKVPLPVGLLFE